MQWFATKLKPSTSEVKKKKKRISLLLQYELPCSCGCYLDTLLHAECTSLGQRHSLTAMGSLTGSCAPQHNKNGSTNTTKIPKQHPTLQIPQITIWLGIFDMRRNKLIHRGPHQQPNGWVGQIPQGISRQPCPDKLNIFWQTCKILGWCFSTPSSRTICHLYWYCSFSTKRRKKKRKKTWYLAALAQCLLGVNGLYKVGWMAYSNC